jgi:hypothetical protein
MKIIQHYSFGANIPNRQTRVILHRDYQARQGTIVMILPEYDEIMRSVIRSSEESIPTSFPARLGVFVSDPKYDFCRKKGLKWASEDMLDVELLVNSAHINFQTKEASFRVSFWPEIPQELKNGVIREFVIYYERANSRPRIEHFFKGG